jgi:flavodoxin
VNAENVHGKEELAENSFVFLGSGGYAGRLGRKLSASIRANGFKGKHVALFGTSGDGKGTQIQALEEFLEARGARIKGSFYSYGRFLFRNRGRPEEEDLTRAGALANRMKNPDA